LDTHLIHPDGLPDVDPAIVERLRPLRMPVNDAAGVIRVGVARDDGVVYRMIQTSSLVEAVRVFEALGDLGLVPRAQQARARGNVNRVFACPP
jgi:hypothetical protein